MDSIEKAILDRWAASAALTALLPAASLHVGWNPEELATDDRLPAAMLNVQSSRGAYTSDGRSTEYGVRIQAWFRKHSDGDALRNEIVGYRNADDEWQPGHFDNASWSAAGIGVTLCRVENASAIQEDDGVWQFVFDLAVTLDGR